MAATGLNGGIDLDDLAHYRRVDVQDALADIEATPQQWADARAAELAGLDFDTAEQVCVVGMGGSGIAGDVLRVITEQELEVPLIVHKGYGVPGFVGSSTVLIAISHSGDTEETLDAVGQAKLRGARVAAVTAGGSLRALAEAEGWPLAAIAADHPPRHSLGWLLVPLLQAFGFGAQLDAAIEAQRRIVQQWGRHVPRADNPAKQLAEQLAQIDLAVVWGTQGLGAVGARRLACQLNENAKLPAYPATLPEANHNAIVGHSLAVRSPRSALLVVRDPAGEHERVAKRVAPTRELLDPHFAWTEELAASADGLLTRTAELVIRADLISVYTALARGIDPTPIAAIDRLKAVLA